MNTTESPTTTSDQTTSQLTVTSQPAGTEPLDFEVVREKCPAIWKTALDADPTITKGGRPDLFLVDIGEEVPQNCSLARTTEGHHTGWCSCRSFDTGTICPHLCVLRQRASLDMLVLPVRREKQLLSRQYQ